MPLPIMARTAKGIDPNKKQMMNRTIIPGIFATIKAFLTY
jgi:hypothetical protein